MKAINKKTPVIILLAILLCGCSKAPQQLLFNDGWQFAITDDALETQGTDGVTWEQVSLPHTPQITEKTVLDQWQGTCWYQKQFDLPSSMKGQLLFLKFDGAMNECDVWINGEHVASHLGGYLPVVLDFTKFAKFGDSNMVLVRLKNTDNPITGPKPLKNLDFCTYGGLYRDAFLISKNPLHITDPIFANKTASGGIFVSYPEVSKEKAMIQVQVHVQNSGKKAESFSTQIELWDGNTLISSVLSKKIEVTGMADTEVVLTMPIADPNLWSPRSPSLYVLKTKLVAGGRMVDSEEMKIGIRQIEITKDGFKINGEKMYLRGVNRHQEYPYVGYALSNEAQYRDAYKIKSAGFDYVRLSHYPQSSAFMDACDELGLLTLDAILGWQYFSRDEAFQNQTIQTCRDLVRRDRNHPSVMAWEASLNESWMDESFIDKAHAAVHEEYPGPQCYSAGWQKYGYDIFVEARQHRLGHYQDSGKPYIVSEYGDWEYYAQNAGFNQESWGNLMQSERSSRQLISDGEVRLLQQATNIQEAHNDNFTTSAFADGYWAMFDYNRGYSGDLESSGIMTIDRLPKFSYYFFQSQRSPIEINEMFESGPMVHIASWWNEQSPLAVRVFSNCSEVELFLNGKSLGRQQPDENAMSSNLAFPPFTFRLSQYESGELTAKGYINEKEMVSHSVKTAGEAQKLALELDESGKPAKCGVNDVLFVHAKLVDEQGNVIRTNDLDVKFEIALGDAQLISPVVINAEAGIASALVRIGNASDVQIKAESVDGKYTGELRFSPK